MQRGWGGICAGGIWWNKERRYKNAIANALFLKVGAELHRRGFDGLGWARRSWSWFSRSGLINERHLVNDGLTPDCRKNGGITWTYNQGVVIGGLVALSSIEGDPSLLSIARQIADATIATLSNEDGILVEPGEPDLGNDGPQFKGIFVRYLHELYDATSEARYRDRCPERDTGMK
jgi:predicted alpha-1,6-mannanase (GH76 family)